MPQLSILRTDVTDEQISGNKWYKLKYNLTEAKKKNLPILTFGGAFSNHIA
ncbi:MAG TPA: 1-aminocyclopropane-1-carboxylate deaminase, partial [Flavobacteriales bacterium]|nr:1-aminocyclopropane-1-carboxylate deaminase [Flavobacteriales bacterium]